MNLLWVLVIVLLLIAVIGMPGVAFQHTYGYYPSGVAVFLVIVVVLFLLMGRP